MSEYELEIEAVAKVLRKDVRFKAGLKLNWGSASEDMKQFYRQQAKKVIDESIF